VTEIDYINATNLAKVRAASNLIQDLLDMDESPSLTAHIGSARRALYDLLKTCSDLVKIS
jgi:hypothetical protein